MTKWFQYKENQSYSKVSLLSVCPPLDESLLYAEVSHKRAKAKRNKEKSASAVIYSEVKSQPALDNSLLYAEVSHNRAKVKIHKGKSASAAADEAVYSEVKSKPALSSTGIK